MVDIGGDVVVIAIDIPESTKGRNINHIACGQKLRTQNFPVNIYEIRDSITFRGIREFGKIINNVTL